MNTKSSPGQIEFIRDGFKINIRGDGRKNDQSREYLIQTGQFKQANGSSFISLNDNSVNIYTGIKVEIGETDNDEGKIILKIESAQRTEQNRDQENHINSDKNTLIYLESLLNKYLIQNICKKSLCIVEKKKCWILNIDVFILESVEIAYLNLISVGINAALEDLVLPKISITHNNLTNEDEITLVEGQFQSFSISKDFKMPKIMLIGQIDRILVGDLTVEEYYSVENKYIVVVDVYQNKIISIKKTGSGFLPPEDYVKIVQFALSSALKK
ncbi:hypothetical protein ABPG72_001818 [Tetrahymena utriculariae]